MLMRVLCCAMLCCGGLQVTFLGDAPVSSGDASHLMDWKEASRRVLLQRSGERSQVPMMQRQLPCLCCSICSPAAGAC